MPNILAVDTATEYCSVALYHDGRLEQRCERIPRKHNTRLFSMLREILPDGDLQSRAIDCLAWNRGPGSFTGLRIAASAVQGLAFAQQLPVASVSTLACLAQGLYSRGELSQDQRALVVLDARINEIYWGLYGCNEGLAVSLAAEGVGPPDVLPLSQAPGSGPVIACGDGLGQLDIAVLEAAGIKALLPEAAPAAVDIIPLAVQAFKRGDLCNACEVQPVYLRDEIGWKKLAEQG